MEPKPKCLHSGCIFLGTKTKRCSHLDGLKILPVYEICGSYTQKTTKEKTIKKVYNNSTRKRK